MMSSQVKNILFFGILIVINCNNFSLAQTNCVKIDFNRTTSPEIAECFGKNQPNFVINTYELQKELIPYRPNSKYYLSYNFHETYSCAESTMQLTVNPTSIIEAAIYFKPVGSSFLEINVYDANRNERIDSLRTDGTNGWQIFHKNLHKTIQNARVCLFLL